MADRMFWRMPEIWAKRRCTEWVFYEVDNAATIVKTVLDLWGTRSLRLAYLHPSDSRDIVLCSTCNPTLFQFSSAKLFAHRLNGSDRWIDGFLAS
jgi:hypothetical protein